MKKQLLQVIYLFIYSFSQDLCDDVQTRQCVFFDSLPFRKSYLLMIIGRETWSFASYYSEKLSAGHSIFAARTLTILTNTNTNLCFTSLSFMHSSLKISPQRFSQVEV